MLMFFVAVVKSGETQPGACCDWVGTDADTVTDRLLSGKMTVITVSFELVLENSDRETRQETERIYLQ